MAEGVAQGDRFDWRLPLYAAIAALVVFLPIVTFGFNLGQILYTFVILPIIGFPLLVIAILIACFGKRLRGLALLSMMAVYCIVTWGLWKISLKLHTEARWLLSSKQYKSEILAQPPPTNGDLKHIEWDGWGWAGIDTTAYLVFDPNDSLYSAAKSHSPVVKIRGKSCGVWRIFRLQSRWYSVVFDTDAGWDDCVQVNEIKPAS
jgi:hypothetical protein